ncbi:MAG: UDPGP type 1 family protein [Actinobacteria bacterium]|nr:UDPGP type 1 family protein [Thermoleophilia bacterium]MCB9011372.1 UDPGP type 1 family protein [Actinomycetota bacterium]
MAEVPPPLAAELTRTGQHHLVDIVRSLPDAAGGRLLRQIEQLDLDLIHRLVERFVHAPEAEHEPGSIGPPDAVPLAVDDDGRALTEQARAEGEAALRAGRVAVVLLAGGQGSRLGFDGPKGDYPFGPVTGRTLFDQHAARIAATRTRYGADLPWYVLTSPANDRETRRIFAAADHFGLEPESIRFVVQGTLPAVDAGTGEILRESPDTLALSPDGHGGLLSALRRSGALDEMAAAGISTFFTFQVDNPLIHVADPVFVGHHLRAGADMSNLAVRKHDPAERVGVIATIGDATGVVEYSDLPDELAAARDDDGSLTLWAGSIATHCIEVAFAWELTEGGTRLPFHRALKKVAHVDADGHRVEPDEPNAVKFETFIFDALPLAGASVTVEVDRAEQFSPIKNATGGDSPDQCRRDCNRLWAKWLRDAGVDVPTDADGEPVDLEIDPRFALDADELRERLPAGFSVDGPTYLGPGDLTA